MSSIQNYEKINFCGLGLKKNKQKTKQKDSAITEMLVPNFTEKGKRQKHRGLYYLMIKQTH